MRRFCIIWSSIIGLDLNRPASGEIVWPFIEFDRPTTRTMSRPELDFAVLARGMGVPCECVTTMEEINAALARGLKVRLP